MRNIGSLGAVALDVEQAEAHFVAVGDDAADAAVRRHSAQAELGELLEMNVVVLEMVDEGAGEHVGIAAVGVEDPLIHFLYAADRRAAAQLEGAVADVGDSRGQSQVVALNDPVVHESQALVGPGSEVRQQHGRCVPQ